MASFRDYEYFILSPMLILVLLFFLNKVYICDTVKFLIICIMFTYGQTVIIHVLYMCTLFLYFTFSPSIRLE